MLTAVEKSPVMPGFFMGAGESGFVEWASSQRSRAHRSDIECNAVFFCEGVIGASLDWHRLPIWFSLLGGRHPPGAGHPTCFALCSSLFRSFLQTQDDHGAIRRPASVPLPRRPVSVVCSFLKVSARNRRTKNQKHRARNYCTESLNYSPVLTVIPAKAGIHTT